MRFIVFGGNGMLGRYVCKYFSDLGHDIVRLTRDELDIYTTSTQDILKYLDKVLKNNEVVINCAGIINKRNVNDLEMYKVNSIFPHILSRKCLQYDNKLYHITTDCVFSGKHGPYENENQHDVFDDYGLSKSIGEPNDPINDKNTCVIRTSIIGEEENNRSLIEWAKRSKGTTINGYTNHLWNGVTCLQLAKEIQHNLGSFQGGSLVIISKNGTDNYINKYDLLNLINRIYELDLNIVSFETELVCDRRLSEKDAIVTDSTLEEQIIEMKIFGTQKL